MSSDPSDRVSRRSLFKGMVAGGAAAALTPSGAGASAAPPPAPPPANRISEPSAAALAQENEAPRHEPGTVDRSGGDYMVDAIKHLEIPYLPTMAGSTFRGLHEALINYGQNQSPEFLTCLHEEVSVAMAHGYAKVAGKPLLTLLHGAVGVQHAAMAIYNAWCDRAPVLMIGGNTLDGTKRRAGVEWQHAVIDQGATVRDFVKWDAQPMSLPDFNEALKRGYQLATTPPFGPVLIMVDAELQETPIPQSLVPARLPMVPTIPVGDPAALERAARMLIDASSPVIIADRLVRTPSGMKRLVELAELLQAPVVDRYGRLNMPTGHYLAQTELSRALVRAADVVLGLELVDPWGTVNAVVDAQERYTEALTNKDFRLITISSRDLLIRSNYQDAQRFQPAELAITGDGEATLPYLVDAVQRALDPGARARIDGRKARLETDHAGMKQRARVAATYGWDASPISTARMCAELYTQLRDLDWGLVTAAGFISNWPMRLWDFDHPQQFTGGAGGAGVGYMAPGTLGAALAMRDAGRLPVGIVGDGDLLCTPTSLWTAAHHKIPMMLVVQNNRAYHQELMHVQRMANRNGRGLDRTHIGTVIDNPTVDFAKMAQSFGAVGIGPVTDPKALPAAFKRAVEVVKSGEPVLVDVITQPR